MLRWYVKLVCSFHIALFTRDACIPGYLTCHRNLPDQPSVRSLLRLKGLDPLVSRGLTTLLQDETDLVCVNGSSFSNPVGLGSPQGAHARGGLMRFLDDLGPLASVEKDVWNELIEAAKHELDEEEASGSCLLSWWVAYGRKPE